MTARHSRAVMISRSHLRAVFPILIALALVLALYNSSDTSITPDLFFPVLLCLSYLPLALLVFDESYPPQLAYIPEPYLPAAPDRAPPA